MNFLFTMLNVTYFFLTVVCHPGAYGGRPSMSAHYSSGSAYETEPKSASRHDTQTEMDAWMGLYNTPPPYTTQETQYDDDGSLIPGCQIMPPNRLG